MKENGIEKLIELLNEYEAKRHKTSIVAEIRKQKEEKLSYLEMNWNYSELLCISKGYLFIQRLVKHDKIDFDKCGICYEINSTYDHYNLEERQDLWLIMLLSIQDSPIEFLISILR